MALHHFALAIEENKCGIVGYPIQVSQVLTLRLSLADIDFVIDKIFIEKGGQVTMGKNGEFHSFAGFDPGGIEVDEYWFMHFIGKLQQGIQARAFRKL